MESFEIDFSKWDGDQFNVVVFLPLSPGQGVAWHVRYLSEAAMTVHLVPPRGKTPGDFSFPTALPQCLVWHESHTPGLEQRLRRDCRFSVEYGTEPHGREGNDNKTVRADAHRYLKRNEFLEPIFRRFPPRPARIHAPARSGSGQKTVLIARRNTGDAWTTINDWFIHGFRQAGHHVVPLHIPYWGAHAYNPCPSITMTNRIRLNHALDKYNPHMVFIIHGGGYWTKEMIEDIKQRGIHTIYFNPDDPMLFRPVSRFIAPHCHTVLAFPKMVETYKQELGIEAHPFFYCLDPDIETGPAPGDETRQKYAADILMTGIINNHRKKRRAELLQGLHDAQIGTVAHYGPPSTDAPPEIEHLYRGQIADNKVHNLILRSARIVFHYTQELLPHEQGHYLPDAFQSLSGRLLDGTAAGCLVMTNHFEDLELAFQPGQEVVVYKDAGDAVEKARYYLQHEDERKRIAIAGQKRVLAQHAVGQRIKQIFSITG